MPASRVKAKPGHTIMLALSEEHFEMLNYVKEHRRSNLTQVLRDLVEIGYVMVKARKQGRKTMIQPKPGDAGEGSEIMILPGVPDEPSLAYGEGKV
jgi:hypothetical protein